MGSVKAVLRKLRANEGETNVKTMARKQFASRFIPLTGMELSLVKFLLQQHIITFTRFTFFTGFTADAAAVHIKVVFYLQTKNVVSIFFFFFFFFLFLQDSRYSSVNEYYISDFLIFVRNYSNFAIETFFF